MKRMLNILALTTLSISAILTVGLVLNSNVVKNLNLNENLNSVNDNPFISFEQVDNIQKMNVLKLKTDNNGIIWAGTTHGLYKKLLNKKFTIVSGISNRNWVKEIEIKNEEILIGTNNDLYKSIDGVNFVKIFQQSINSLTIENNGTVWVGTLLGLYKSTDGVNFISVEENILGNFNIDSLVISNNGTVWVGTSSNGLWKSTDGVNFDKQSFSVNSISCLVLKDNNIIWVGTSSNGLWKSTDGVNFSKVNGDISTGGINSLVISNNGTVWVGTNNGLYKSEKNDIFNNILSEDINSTFIDKNERLYANYNNGFYKLDLLDNLITLKQPDYNGPKYNGFVYNKEQKIDLKKDYLKSATLDGHDLTISSAGVPITVGKHALVLTVKDEVKQYLDLFGGNTTTGTITYNFWVKTVIDSSTEFNYSTKADDTDLLTGLVSNAGNTNGCAIINTRARGAAVHPATLTTTITSNMIDLNKSYYVKGTVLIGTNNFVEIPGARKPVTENLSITDDGIYHLHLVDVVDNVYDSYFELGKANWKLHGDFDDVTLKKLETQLNVTVSVSSPVDKQIAMGWLQNYQSDVLQTIANSISDKGKGFDIAIKPNQYIQFLDHVDYNVASYYEAINQVKLNKLIADLANKALSDSLNKLPKDLNVDTSNVVNRQTLDSYTSWITGYQYFINKYKNQWFKQVSDVASRGFVTPAQMQQIKSYLNGLNFSDYLQHITWKPNSMLAISNDYKQFVLLDKLQADIITWVNQNIPAINQAYQNAINQAESNINMHGYKLSDLLDGNQLPQTKSQIDNYKNGLSFHDWLQKQADSLYHTWQLKIGLGIGLPLLAVVSFGIWLLYLRYSHKHRPIRRAKNEFRPKPYNKIKAKPSKE